MSLSDWRYLKEQGFLSSWVPMTRDDSRPVENFHGAFIPQVASYYLERLATRDKDFWTWDPMAGSGTTGLVAGELDINCLMTDLNPTNPDIQEGEAGSIFIARDKDGQPVVRNDLYHYARGKDPRGYLRAREELFKLERFLFDLIVWHPPYSNIIVFSEDENDLSNVQSHTEFIVAFRRAARNIVNHLKPFGWVGLVIGDVWQTGKAEVIPLGFQTMTDLLGIMDYEHEGSRLKAIAVKNIEGNRPDKSYHLRLSRYARWGTNDFKHEYLFTLRAGG